MDFSDRIRLYNKLNFALMYPKYNLFHLADKLKIGVTSCSVNTYSIMNSFTNQEYEVENITDNTKAEDIIKPNRIYHITYKDPLAKYPHHLCFAQVEDKYYQLEACLKVCKLDIEKLSRKKCLYKIETYLGVAAACKDVSISIDSCKIDDHEIVLQNIANNVFEFVLNANDEDKAKYFKIHKELQLLLD